MKTFKFRIKLEGGTVAYLMVPAADMDTAYDIANAWADTVPTLWSMDLIAEYR